MVADQSNLMSKGGGAQKLMDMLPAGHVIHTLVQEHSIILSFLRSINDLKAQLLDIEQSDDAVPILAKMSAMALNIMETKNHHLREEHTIFAELERRELSSLTSIMRREHELINPMKKHLLNLLKRDPNKRNFQMYKSEVGETCDRLVANLVAHIQKEDNVIFPEAVQAIDDPVIWRQLRETADSLGYCAFTPTVPPLSDKAI